mmetsp:Transcript_16354/g.32494  ORF Transcript_16354/g.32494 Transcript_16354/m.32494 type:complete len:102 (+) Transcript_16354:820-1125(+)
MPKGRYQGLVKDNDSGTMMECYVHPGIDYSRVPEMLETQRAFITERICLRAMSHIIHPPLRNFGILDSEKPGDAAARLLKIPGVAEADWTPQELSASLGAN